LKDTIYADVRNEAICNYCGEFNAYDGGECAVEYANRDAEEGERARGD